jgi:RNA polymerase sigma-70 factor (ECF subfamily)
MIGELPDPYREAVQLVEVDGMSQKDAADRLGLSVSGAKSRVQRGRERLRRMLAKCCHVELDRRGNAVDYKARSGCC